jgi:uncharacterized protein (UPF0332 family)
MAVWWSAWWAAVFSWWDYYDLAWDLSQQKGDASLRSAVSRAYYAAYHTAKSWAVDHEFSLSKNAGKGSHEQLWRFMEEREEPKAKAVAELGRKARDLRVLCDYRLT